MVLRQLAEALLQRISQEVEFLTGLIETSLGLETGREVREESQKGREGRGVEMDGNISNMAFFPVFAWVEHCRAEGSDSMTRTWILQPSMYL